MNKTLKELNEGELIHTFVSSVVKDFRISSIF